MSDFLTTYQPKYGWIQSNDQSPAFPSVRTLNRAGRRAMAASADLEEFVEAARLYGPTAGWSPILDQGPSSSCVPHGASMGWRTSLFAQAIRSGAPNSVLERIDLPNLLAGYDGARTVSGGPDGWKEDEGTQIQAWYDYAERLGLPREHDPDLNLTFDAGRVTEKVIDNALVQRAANDFKLLDGVTRIDRVGLGRLELRDAIDEALSNDEPVIGGFPLGNGFFGLRPGEVYRRDGSWVGNHAVAIIGFDQDKYKIVNSWSDGWCDRGYGYLAKDWVLNEGRDLHRASVKRFW